MNIHNLLIVFLSYFLLFVKADDCQKGRVETGVGGDYQTEIVDKHNELRKQIANEQVPGQPRGVNLKRMSWDQGLADAAQNIANTCKFEHVEVHDDRWNWIGQNLYQWQGYNSGGPEAVPNGEDWTSAIMSWFDEHNQFEYPTGSGAGHYTQVVWADTTQVGCGFTSYVNNDDWKVKYYVCNYGPGGNYVGQAPYETGDSGCEDLC